MNGFSLVLDVDVELSGRQSPVDESHFVVFLLLLEHVRLTGAVNLHVKVL